MAIFRILFAAYLLIEACTYLPFVPQMFSDQALTMSLWADLVPPSVRFLFELPPPTIAWVIASVYLIACIGLMIGCGMRTCVTILLILFLYYWQVSFFLFPSSYHRIYFFTLIAFLISGADKTFSVRMLRTHRSFFAWEPIMIFAQRLLAVQITVTYLGVGLQKAWLPVWQDGRALSYSIIGRWGTSLGRWVVSLNLPFWFYSVNVFLIKIGEVFLPFMLWTKRWRWYAVAMGVAFHVGIAVLMSIWWFIPLIPAYIVFWQPEEVYEWLNRRFPGVIR